LWSALILVVGNLVFLVTGTSWLFGVSVPINVWSCLPVGVCWILIFYGMRTFLSWISLIRRESADDLQKICRKSHTMAMKISSMCIGAAAFYVASMAWVFYRFFI
jgi:hypothetical protein